MQIIQKINQKLIWKLKQDQTLTALLNAPFVVSKFEDGLQAPFLKLGGHRLLFVEQKYRKSALVKCEIALHDGRSNQALPYAILEQLSISLQQILKQMLAEDSKMMRAELKGISILSELEDVFAKAELEFLVRLDGGVL